VRQELSAAQQRVARIAAGQYGVVTYDQLLAAGMTPSTVSRRVREGWLHRLYRGVYALGHVNLSTEGRWFAAVCACGPGAVLSHESAAHIWGISPPSASVSHVTVPATGGRARRPGIRIHYSPALPPGDVTIRRKIPVTTPARTRRDLGYGPDRTRSGLERHFLRLCRQHELPEPEVNARIGPYEVDFLWREARLVVEVDGYRYHSSRATFRADRARDRELGRRGLTVLRFADDELDDDPLAVMSSVRDRLPGLPRRRAGKRYRTQE
jgi:very-short-patch-repair endonuclease